MADATPTAPGLTEADREHLRVRLASWFGDVRQAFLVSHLAPAVERIKADACAQATGDMSALHQQVAECEWLLRMTMDARDRAERQAEALDAAFERIHKVLHGWEHDGPDDPATRLLIQRVREALLTGGEVGTGAGEGATGQDTGTAWVTRSEDCPEAPAQAHLPAGEVACPRCGGSMRFCECMDDPFAPAPSTDGSAEHCGCGIDGDGMCPCGCDDLGECDHEWLDRPESDTRKCLICGTEVAG